MVKNGNKVVVDGREATVVAFHAAGRHTQAHLSDGRTVLDLEKKIESGVARVVDEPVARVSPVRFSKLDEGPQVFGEDNDD